MARKEHTVPEAEAEPVLEARSPFAVPFHVYRSERFPFNALCEEYGISSRDRSLIGFRIDHTGITVMRSRGKSEHFAWQV